MASDAFWASLYVEGIEAEHYPSLAELTRAADAVVLGQIVAARPGRVVRDLEAEANGADPRDSVFFLDLEVRVDRVLAGSFDGPVLTLELLLPNVVLLDGLVASFPSERVVLFTRSVSGSAAKGGQPQAVVDSLAGLYRLCIGDAVLRDENGAVRPLPDASAPYLTSLAGRSFDAVAAEIAGLAAQG